MIAPDRCASELRVTRSRRFFGKAEITARTTWSDSIFQHFEMLDAKITIGSEQDHPEFPLGEEAQISISTKLRIVRIFPEREKNRLHDLRLLSGNWRS